MLAACAARRWLARNAAGTKRIHSVEEHKPAEWTSLFCCLPALEDVMLMFDGMLTRDDLVCLLEALAGCSRLRALNLPVECIEDANGEGFAEASIFAKLSSLTKLYLRFREIDPFNLNDVVGALAPLTGLADLCLGLSHDAVVPAALGQFKGLRSLALYKLCPCVLEAGCLDLPNLQSLEFDECTFEEDAQVLPGVTALRCLTRIEFTGVDATCFFDPGLSQLPQLQHIVMSPDTLDEDEIEGHLGLLRLPADMGVLASSLLHLDVSMLQLPQFPRAVTQLVALEFLDASGNEFVQLPAGLTALSRLTELRLGRAVSETDPVQLREKRPLDVRALGDLSGFPALRVLTLDLCEAKLCHSMLGAARHASLACLCFGSAHPAPECALMVLQLCQELRRVGRGSVVRLVYTHWRCRYPLQEAQGQAPCQKFRAALEACGL